MNDNKVSGLMGETFAKIQSMVDVNTAIGEPINLADGTVIIPVNKVNYGFGAGGSDLPSKNATTLFGGGSGGGVTITPTAFLIVKNGNVKVVQIEPFTSSMDRVIQNVPDVVDKIAGLIKKDDKENEE